VPAPRWEELPLGSKVGQNRREAALSLLTALWGRAIAASLATESRTCVRSDFPLQLAPAWWPARMGEGSWGKRHGSPPVGRQR
jgi:hypothetical protein